MSSSGSNKLKKGGKSSTKNSSTKQKTWCSLRKNDPPLWYNPDLSMFTHVVRSAYDAIEDRGLKSAAVIVTRAEFAMACYWYLYATWFTTYCEFWNTWDAPYPNWMRGTPRQYKAVFANLKVPSVIHQAAMSVITPMKALGQIFYPCPGKWANPCGYTVEGDPFPWTRARDVIDRETARYQVNFGYLYNSIVGHDSIEQGNIPELNARQQRGYPGYDDPPDEDYRDPAPNAHRVLSAFDFGLSYLVMPRLMLRMINFLETIGLKDKEIVSYNSVRDVPAPENLVYSMFGLGTGMRPVPNEYLRGGITIFAEDSGDLKEEVASYSLALFTMPYEIVHLQRINIGEEDRCYVLRNPELYLRASTNPSRWFSYLPEMVRLNLNVAQIVLADQ